MQVKKIKKLYYSIGEVSDITGLKQYVLRYWETEFPHLKPSKNSAGNRIYRQNDIDNLLEIKNLLHIEKFTIKGAKQYLKTHKSEKKSVQKTLNKVVPLSKDEIHTLKKIKLGIEELLKNIDSLKD
mgnify:FL=1|tara:strand:- start:275 stop:652 length:378 start_codon:yes stop_codon:yes gene_type:complete